MDKEFKSELKEIIEARKAVYRPSFLLLAVIIAGVIVEYFLPSIGAIFGVIAFVIFYKRFSAAARLPCPRCHQPFGTATKVPLGLGGEQCQNCGLNLNAQ